MKKCAYAKLNLSLAITGIDENGYHLLDMLMQEISLCDYITVEKAPHGIVTESDIPLPESNSAYKAAEAFFEFTHISGGARIIIEKHIPAMSGLGGGSSDGAAVINALNELYETDLSLEEMCRLALFVGSDVPFFISGGCARVFGTGEHLIPAENNFNCRYVLLMPFDGVSTKEAYARCVPSDSVGISTAAAEKAMHAGDLEFFADNAGNALYNAACDINRDIPSVMNLLCDADFHMMTGSGSCCFGMYTDMAAAEAAIRRAEESGIVRFACIAEAVSG